MLGSPILDVAIGMAFIYLLLSLIASAVQELLSSLVETRSANLYNGVRSLLSGDTRLVKLLYSHGLIAGLYKNPNQDFAGLGRSWCSHIRTALQPIIGIRRLAPPPADEPTSDPLLLPAYIPARTFALALMDLLNGSRASGSGMMRSIGENLRSGTEDGRAHVAIEALALRAGDDTEAFQGYLEDWYNDAMDRVSGWYKKHVQNILLVVAVVLSVTFNVDSIRLGRTLWIEPTLRQTLATTANVYVQHPPASAIPTGDPGKDLNATVDAFNQVSGNLNLPVGWHHTLPQYWDTAVHPTWDLLRSLLQALVGWIITAAALSFGAPFWFDTLNRFMIVRGTVKPREKSSVDPPKD